MFFVWTSSKAWRPYKVILYLQTIFKGFCDLSKYLDLDLKADLNHDDYRKILQSMYWNYLSAHTFVIYLFKKINHFLL